VTDDQLRQAFQDLSRNAAFGPECPPPDRLWAGARGELPPGEVEAVAVHLAECGACAEAWRVARDFGTRVELDAPKAAFPWWLAAAAAVVIVAAGSALVYLRRPAVSTTPAVAIAPTFTIPIEKAPIKVSSKYALTWRGANDGQAFLAALKTALAPYERGDYPAAIASLSAVVSQYGDTMEPSYYLGVSQLLAGNPAAAIERLEHARDLADPDVYEDVTWYLAAAYERAGRRADAQRFAQSVCDARGPRAPAACAAATVLVRQP
jgi:tetratricopeptide (TPR) repeat protein